jgi:hypothetical protein
MLASICEGEQDTPATDTLLPDERALTSTYIPTAIPIAITSFFSDARRRVRRIMEKRAEGLLKTGTHN